MSVKMEAKCGTKMEENVMKMESKIGVILGFKQKSKLGAKQEAKPEAKQEEKPKSKGRKIQHYKRTTTWC